MKYERFLNMLEGYGGDTKVSYWDAKDIAGDYARLLMGVVGQHPGISVYGDMSQLAGELGVEVKDGDRLLAVTDGINGRIPGKIRIGWYDGISRDKFEGILAHEVAHVVVDPDVELVMEKLKERGGRKFDDVLGGLPDSAYIQRMLIGFWMSLKDGKSVSDYAGKYWDSGLELERQREYMEENLCEAYAALRVGDVELADMKRRNSAAVEFAKGYFEFKKMLGSISSEDRSLYAKYTPLLMQDIK